MDITDTQTRRGTPSPVSWSAVALDRPQPATPAGGTRLLGVLPGEGIGPEVVAVTLDVLAALDEVSPLHFEIVHGGPIGRDSEAREGKPLSDEVIAFATRVFDAGGAILCGPGGGRFVYDMRRHFDLYFKLSPVKALPELFGANHLKAEHLADVDMLVVRENSAGLYQGVGSDERDAQGRRRARHDFGYDEGQVRRILEAGARIAARRRGELVAVYKDAGVPSISALWRDVAAEVSEQHGIRHHMVDIDLAAYQIIQHAQRFDVVVAPNLFGDVLSDLAGVLLGSRGLCGAASFGVRGEGVYQTNHGAAYDLAGQDVANPVGQVFSLAQMLRESFGLDSEARLVEDAVAAVWRQGWRTADVSEPGCRTIGTRAFGERIAECVTRAGGVTV